jgi:hypothetical protein
MGHLPFPHPRISRWSIRPMLPASLAAHHGLVIVVVMLVALPAVSVGRTWHVPGDAPTIRAAIDSTQAGDDVLVAPGVYLEHNISMKGAILVHSEQGAAVTTVDCQSAGRAFSCTDLQDQATIEGLTIRNGRIDEDGGGVRCVRANLLIQGCVITSCRGGMAGGGVYAEDATLRIEDCEISFNRCGISGGGIFSIRTQLVTERCVITRNIGSFGGGGMYCGGAFDILDCLIARNSSVEGGLGWALGLAGTGRIVGSTVVGHMGTSYSYLLDALDANLSIDRTIFALNPYGELFVGSSTGVSLHCCDIYGNGSDEIFGTDLGGNFSADPLFCDAASYDYTLDANSPCLPGGHPQGVDCGLIGALGMGCGAPPPSGACCLSSGSCLVLEPAACMSQTGIYMGDGTTCDSHPCQPTRVQGTTWGQIKAAFR